MKFPIVLITGASQGIGAAIAKVFARQARSCRLALVARHAAKLRVTARACRRLGAAAVEIFPCDVTEAEAVAALARAVQKRLGVPDVLINNAGGFVSAPFLKTSLEKFDEMVAMNLRSVFLVSRAFVSAMARRRSGHIFIMGSIASIQALPGTAAYSASKYGVLGLARVMREELKASGVRVTAVLPGPTWSSSWKGSGVRPSRLMPAEEVAQTFFDAWKFSSRTVVEEIVLQPQLGAIK